MAAQLRVLRRRIRSVQSTKKITRAMELIASARIVKAQQRVEASKPYAEAMTRVLTALASESNLDHPLLTERENPDKAAVLVVTSDRGLAGAYNSNVLRRAAELQALLRDEGKEPVLYVIGRKGVSHYRFRQRPMAATWTGSSEEPHYDNAREVGETLVNAFIAGTELDEDDVLLNDEDVTSVDEVHIVFTQFQSALVQRPVARRIAPIEVEESDEEPAGGPLPEFFFEPEPEELLAAILPKYVNARIYSALLDSAASESAARRRAMKAATDNAEELIKAYTRQANSARQAEITQEISEIVGGANALAAAGSEQE
jgi:F-type H+-transporting ATPase subunit gamma